MTTSRNGKTIISRIALVLTLAPIMAHAHEYGPDWGYTAAPGDNKTACVSSGCHAGTVNSGPSGANGVKITLPAGNSGTYSPGQTMQITVTVADTTKIAFGFEMTARMGVNNTQQAGLFVPTDRNTQVICADGTTFGNTSKNTACPAQFPIQDIEHTEDGWTASYSSSTKGAFSFQFNWTAPAASAGTVTFYVAGNAGVGQPAVATPSNVYTSTLAVTPGAAPAAPAITSGGVVPVFSTSTSIQAGSWISIYGTNFANTMTVWNGDFPTSLGGVTVTIDGKPAYIWFVGMSQINAQVPDDANTGSVNVTVTNAGGSATTTATLAEASPSWSLLDTKHVAGIAVHPDGSYDIVGPTGSSLGYATKAARAGDVVELFGVGFGPTDPAVAAGQPFAKSAPTVNPVNVTVGGTAITPDFAGLTGAGLFQINLKIPAGLGAGDLPLSAIVAGASTPSGVVISLE